jgi:two-component system response regulator DctR
MPDQPQKKILIIDDEEDIVYTIQEICKYSGYDTITANNGIDGVKMCADHNPNLVIVDYHMPGWDGLTTVKKIKSTNEAVAILVLTVDERQEISDKFIEVGATDFAIKPIKAPDLIARINVNLKINEMQLKSIASREQIFVEKGISAATLSVVLDFMKSQPDPTTIDDIALGVNLAYQTVHRYVHHLLDREVIEVIPVYGQVGRPKNLYKCK